MAFTLTSDTQNGIAKIQMTGELDANVANQLKVAVEKAAADKAKRLVLMVSELSYMASAGLRALVFAKQKMGSGVQIFVVGAQESVAETIEMTGFQNSVVMLTNYDAATIEAA